MEILIAGDLFISEKHKNQNLFDEKIIKLFHEADFKIVNLEAPLTENNENHKIAKTGPHLRSSTETTVPFLQKLKIDLVTLANNHILDYGSFGLINTMQSLKRNGISYVGAGTSEKEAKEFYTFQKDGIKVAILNFAENEWSIAVDNSPGANPLNIIDNVNQIKSAKETHDKVICIIHGGNEFNQFPSPRMVKQYRFYVENGADAIICHHPHCISGYETYKGSPIFYSLGNFIFTLDHKHEGWYKGMVVKLKISKKIEFDTFYTEQCKLSSFSTITKNRNKIDLNISEINKTIKNPELLQKKWTEFVRERQEGYLKMISPLNAIKYRYLRGGLFFLGFKFLTKRALRYLYILMNCEAHSDALKTVLRSKCYSNSYNKADLEKDQQNLM